MQKAEVVGDSMVKDISGAVQRLYEGAFTAYEFAPETDEKTGITHTVKREYLREIPCRISFHRISNNRQSRFPGYVDQEVKLFTSPEIEIKEGSEIAVMQNGRIVSYEMSGAPAVYTGHQEIILKIKNVR